MNTFTLFIKLGTDDWPSQHVLVISSNEELPMYVYQVAFAAFKEDKTFTYSLVTLNDVPIQLNGKGVQQ